MNIKQTIILVSVLLTALVSRSEAQRPPNRNIAQTPHNLSISGGGGQHDIHSLTESRICIFCHTPHHASNVTPLWSREMSTLTTYIPYYSTTLKGTVKPAAVPRGPSRLCLSCHDGTIALGLLVGGYNLDPALRSFNDMPQETDPTKNPNLGTDLSNDHPISFPYSYPQNMELYPPEYLASHGIKLDDGTYVECTSCHDPHNNQYGNFLLVDSRTQHDTICTTCHNITGWTDPDNAHRTGGGQYAGGWTYIASDGCLSCHIPHNAQPGPYLLRAAEQLVVPQLWPQQVAINLTTGASFSLPQAGGSAARVRKTGKNESICFSTCHKEYPYKDIWSEFNTMAYTHPISEGARGHRKNETLPLSPAAKHVDCADCHNPHQAGTKSAAAGLAPMAQQSDFRSGRIKGPLRGVRGVVLTGTASVKSAGAEYEICFKCHSGKFADKFVSLVNQRPARQYPGFDESLRFAQANPSFHPVLADRQGTGRSLLTALQGKMIRIDCTDCHAPHGSNEQHILAGENIDTYPSSATNYPLCYRCHDPDYLLNPMATPHAASVTLHRSHVLDHSNRAPCSACHDPHGPPLANGATAFNASHLVNFDTRYAGSVPMYNASSRSCTVNCHTNPTIPRVYFPR